MREAIDWLRDKLAQSYEEKGRSLFKDPWAARDGYIHVILDRSPENIDQVLGQHAGRNLKETDKITALKLLELQRHAMLMYTSCGWFFDELSGIETIQVIQYAARAIQLYEDLFGDTLESQFLEGLERAKGNIPENRDGRMIYKKFVKPAMVDLKKVGSHYAIRSVFEPYAERAQIYCYTVDREDYLSPEAGKMRMALGRAKFTSKVTQESSMLTFGVLHFGEHNLSGGVKEFREEESYPAMIRGVTEAFSRADIPGVIRTLEGFFGVDICFLKSLFREEQGKILKQILDRTLGEAEAVYRKLYEQFVPLMRFLSDLRVPFPKSFQTAAEFALNSNLRRVLEDKEINWNQISSILEEAKLMGVPLDEVGLSYSFKAWIERIAAQFQANPKDLSFLKKLASAVDLACSLSFKVDFWRVQNIYHEILQMTYPEFRKKAENGEEGAQTWVGQFTLLGEELHCRIV